MENITLVLPYKYSKRIYYISYLTFTSIFTSLYLKLYDFSLLTILVLLTSLNYWKHPVNNWRRTLDMYIVIMSFLYTMNKSIYGNIYNRHRQVYYLCNLLGICFYTLARKNKCKHKSSLYHCGIHVISNVGNIILYLGLE